MDQDNTSEVCSTLVFVDLMSYVFILTDVLLWLGGVISLEKQNRCYSAIERCLA